MSKAKKEINVELKLTDGWEERVAKAAYNLYLYLESEEKEKLESIEKDTA